MKIFKTALITMLFIFLTGGVVAAVFYFTREDNDAVKVFLHVPGESFALREKEIPPPPEEEYIYEEPEEFICPYTVTITLSAAGDTTLGGDRRWGGYHAFMREYRYNGLEFFFANVAQIFYESDLSIVNLEGTLTDITEPHTDKEFVFRGPPEFAQILVYGNIDAVSLGNNHSQDFMRQSYYDTKDALTAVGIAYFGNETNTIIEVNGIYVGLFGHRVWGDHRYNRNRITNAIADLRERGAQLIIAFNHWGVEGENFPEPYQRSIGRFTLQEGADLVLGAHPHVLQGIEEYNGRFIVHSLADFSFGGNASPSDMDSFIFQQTFTFYRGVLQPENEINIIPVSMSSVRYRNNFQPTPVEGDDAERIFARLEEYSEALR